MTITGGTLFCFGLGYSARRLAKNLIAEGWSVAGTCGDPQQQEQLAIEGYDVSLFDRGTPLPDEYDPLDRATHILSSVPPDDGDPVVDLVGKRIATCNGLVWVGYLSTTGVYGDTGGAWVDEDTPLRPTGERSRRRANAERAWLDLGANDHVPVHVFRLAGIYGPARSAIDTVRAGRARRIDKPGHLFSRIHVEDLAAVLMASMHTPRPGAIYNVCDDAPAPQEQVVAYACELLGVEPPPLVPFEEAELSDMARSFYADNRRVRNDLVKSAHGLRLRYPTYREGLSAIANLIDR